MLPVGARRSSETISLEFEQPLAGAAASSVTPDGQRLFSAIRAQFESYRELQQARRETILADRLAAVGEMAAGVAHELRNPLTSVKLLIQTAADRSVKEDVTAQDGEQTDGCT